MVYNLTMDQSIEKQAASIFIKAANYIRQHGWQVSGMGQDGLPRCSMGALESAYPEPVWDQKLSQTMYDALYKQLNGLSLTEFNYKYRNGDKVARLFEQTASSLY